MPMALCDLIPIMDLIQEMKNWHIPVICSKPYIYCKVFKDNGVVHAYVDQKGMPLTSS
jgi:hypothetical protein